MPLAKQEKSPSNFSGRKSPSIGSAAAAAAAIAAAAAAVATTQDHPQTNQN